MAINNITNTTNVTLPSIETIQNMRYTLYNMGMEDSPVMFLLDLAESSPEKYIEAMTNIEVDNPVRKNTHQQSKSRKYSPKNLRKDKSKHGKSYRTRELSIWTEQYMNASKRNRAINKQTQQDLDDYFNVSYYQNLVQEFFQHFFSDMRNLWKMRMGAMWEPHSVFDLDYAMERITILFNNYFNIQFRKDRLFLRFMDENPEAPVEMESYFSSEFDNGVCGFLQEMKQTIQKNYLIWAKEEKEMQDLVKQMKDEYLW